ncbi:MAG: HAMP domain-containing histidine kinase [Rhodocyclaceae bacterium]|nr:HAMP domain-containing histidine kinase [Rhodocyclaceae bacterium]MBK7815660.1 HAMP domain-containing histidine kinase [Rhodocyclaceae bacterium]
MSLFPSLSRFVLGTALRWRRQLLVAVLALLYLVLILGPATPLARVLFVVHLGLLIVWQPFVRADQRLGLAAIGRILLAVGLMVYWLNGWLLTLWIILLAGVVGGKVFLYEARWSKLFYLFALSWLVAVLLLLAMPTTVPSSIAAGSVVVTIGEWMAPAVLAMMLLLPERKEADDQAEVVDFVYSVIVMLLLAVLVLGSLAIMLLLGHAYIDALLEALLGIGLALLILGWVWNPHLGMAGVGTVFSRYLMSVGMPVEQWLHTLADLAQRRDDPDDFLVESCRDMVRVLPWVTGVAWRAPGGPEGQFGACQGRSREFRFDTLALRIYSRFPLSPSLAWHFSLLAQLVAEFRADKLRARQLKHMSYVEAIHETGARLTHDVKNLLQSLRTLCTAAQNESGGVTPEFVSLLQRQLPAITARLEQTLDKLRAPRLRAEESTTLADWWERLQARFALADIRFAVEHDAPALAVSRYQAQIPTALFNHVVENLVANALDKRGAHPALRIDVTLGLDARGARVKVSDDGAPVPPALAASLFRAPVASETGTGIGLYQAARLLEGSGYALALAANLPGRVSFVLAPAGS